MPKRILIITLGATPQVVTETLWVLLKRPTPWVPDEIFLATTGTYKSSFETTGFARKVSELYADAGMADRAVECQPRVPKDSNGAELLDVRTDEHAAAFGTLIAKLVNDHRGDDTQIHVSLAGGRKTMSWFGGAAISLLGRPQDELSHVLVEPEGLEGCADFWWPTKEKRMAPHKWEKNTDGSVKHYNTQQGKGPDYAKVELASIPFVPLEAYLKFDPFDGGDIDFASVVERARGALEAQQLVIDCENRSLRFGGYHVKLTQMEFAHFRLHAEAKVRRWPESGQDGEFGWLRPEVIKGDIADIYLEYYKEVNKGEAAINVTSFAETLQSVDKLRKHHTAMRAKTKIDIVGAIRNQWASQQLEFGGKGHRFGLIIPESKIRIISPL